MKRLLETFLLLTQNIFLIRNKIIIIIFMSTALQFGLPIIRNKTSSLEDVKLTRFYCNTAKTRSDRDKLCHFLSKMKKQESQNKLFLSIA